MSAIHGGLQFLVAVAVAATLASGCDDLDVVTNSYATLTEAQAAGAVERGWLPAIVPSGAHDIREAHDQAGSRRRWGIFSFRPEDADQLRAALGTERSFAGLGANAPPRIEWWPVQLRGTLNAERLAATGLKAYPVAGDQLVAAVNWNQRRAYYWSPR
jgi:hypothetical protein